MKYAKNLLVKSIKSPYVIIKTANNKELGHTPKFALVSFGQISNSATCQALPCL